MTFPQIGTAGSNFYKKNTAKDGHSHYNVGCSVDKILLCHAHSINELKHEYISKL